MKTISILWVFIVTILIFTSCQTDDLATPAMTGDKVEISAKRAGETSVVYSGNANGINATITIFQNGTVVSNQAILSNTGLLPATGGSLFASDSNVIVEGVISAETLNASITGQNNQTFA